MKGGKIDGCFSVLVVSHTRAHSHPISQMESIEHPISHFRVMNRLGNAIYMSYLCQHSLPGSTSSPGPVLTQLVETIADGDPHLILKMLLFIFHGSSRYSILPFRRIKHTS